tara:strand:+ start:1200 stop:2141 length:942 start_codon:yes stop_codon:yes gene_type:complete
MANVLDNIKRTAFEAFYSRLGENVSAYRKLGDNVVMTTDTHSLQVYNAWGVTHFAAQSAGTDPTPEDILSAKNTITSSTLEKAVKITEQDALDNPDLLPELAQQMADAGASSIANTFWTAVGSLHSTEHPNAYKVDGSNGAVNFIDADFGKIRVGGVDKVTLGQTNRLTSALSSSALNSAKGLMQAYKNDAGIPINPDMANENLCLVVPAALAATGRDLVSLSQPFFKDDLSASVGTFGGMDLAVAPYLDGTDANNWFLFHKKYSPVRIWIRKAPTLRIETLQATGHISIYSSGIWASVLMPHEMGVVGSIVA